MSAEIKARLNQVFQDIFNDDTIEIQDATTAKDMDQWDSLMHITLMVAIEKEFGIHFNTTEVAKLENVGALLKMIDAKLPGRKGE